MVLTHGICVDDKSGTCRRGSFKTVPATIPSSNNAPTLSSRSADANTSAALKPLRPKQIASLAGVAPFNVDSGTSRGKRAIWRGRSALRRVLYMAVVSGIRCNATIKAFYTRLREMGKPPKVASSPACGNS